MLKQHQHARILLVDDNAINQEVALMLLERFFLALETAENGLVALKKIAQKHFDLILMDVQMPEMDGLTAAKAIRTRPDYANVPIIAMTASTFEEDQQKCIAAGMNDFITKPMSPEILYQKLFRWLSLANPAHFKSTPPIFWHNALSNDALTDIRSYSIPKPESIRDLVAVTGDFTRYQRLLYMFVDTHSGDLTRIIKFLATADMTEAHRLTHRLNGAAAVLGAERLSTAATNLDNALRHNKDHAECLQLAKLCESELAILTQAILSQPID